MNLSAISSSDDNWNKRVDTDIDFINETDNVTVSLADQIQSATDTINDNEKSVLEQHFPHVTAPETDLSEESELNAYRTEEDNINESDTKTFDVTSPLIEDESTNSESTASFLSSQDYTYSSHDESQESKTAELLYDNSQHYSRELDSGELLENADSAVIGDTRDAVKLVKFLILLTELNEQMMVSDETEISSKSREIPDTSASLFGVNF